MKKAPQCSSLTLSCVIMILMMTQNVVGQSATAPVRSQAQPACSPYNYTVRVGDSLTGIAVTQYGGRNWQSYRLIAETNGIANPDMIRVGDKLTIPCLDAAKVSSVVALKAAARKVETRSLTIVQAQVQSVGRKLFVPPFTSSVAKVGTLNIPELPIHTEGVLLPSVTQNTFVAPAVPAGVVPAPKTEIVSVASQAQSSDNVLKEIQNSLVVVKGSNGDANGICIDASCSMVATNHHVVEYLRIENGFYPESSFDGDHTLRVGEDAQMRSATGPNDVGVQRMPVGNTGKSIALALERDFALVELSHQRNSVRGSRAVRFARELPKIGDKVFKGAYENGKLVVLEGLVMGINQPITFPSGQTMSSGGLYVKVSSRPGNSGGGIFNTRGELLGIISVVMTTNDDEAEKNPSVVALSMQAVSSAIRKIDWTLAQNLFGDSVNARAVVVGESRPQVELPSSEASRLPVVGEKEMVEKLKEFAGENLRAMTNLVATQILDRGTRKRELYEVRIANNGQSFQKISGGQAVGPVIGTLPLPRQGIRPGDDWSEPLSFVGDVKLVYEGSKNGVQKFVYTATASDGVCSYEEHSSKTKVWTGDVGCSGTILTNFSDIMAISRDLDLPPSLMTRFFHTRVVYKKTDLTGKVLVPVNGLSTVTIGNKAYFLETTWINYHLFQVESHLLMASAMEE